MNQITDLQYFGNINYFNILLKIDAITFNTSCLYQKGWFGNKTVITGANGTIVLSTPLLGGRNQKSVYKDVKIAYDQPWRQQHKKAILSCYGNAPYFDYYYFFIENLFQQKFEYLVDLNLHIFEQLIKLLKVKIDFNLLDDVNYSKENIIGSKKYFQENQFQHNITYPQVFEDRNGFIENLSIIDLLFCTGPQANNLIKIS
jgi:hypothetical protein